MATKSIHTIRGLDDLLINIMEFRDPKKAEQAAENVRYPILHGIAAIGDLLWWADQNEDFGKDGSQTIGDVGILIKELATIAQTMSVAKDNAAHQIASDHASDQSEFVSVPVFGIANAEVAPS